MITTRFLDHDEYHQAHDFLLSMTSDSRAIYFGTCVSDEYINRLFARIADDTRNHQFLVAESNGCVVGMIHVAVIDTRSIELAICVSDNNRRQGIGDRLMREVLVWARNRLFSRIFLHCMTRNLPVRRLCERHHLVVHNSEGDSEASVNLPPPSFYSLFRETEKNLSDLVIMSLFARKSSKK